MSIRVQSVCITWKWALAASPQPPVELLLQKIPFFADSLQHGAVLLGPAHQVGDCVLHRAIWN